MESNFSDTRKPKRIQGTIRRMKLREEVLRTEVWECLTATD